MAVKRCASGSTSGDAAVAKYRIYFMYDVWACDFVAAFFVYSVFMTLQSAWLLPVERFDWSLIDFINIIIEFMSWKFGRRVHKRNLQWIGCLGLYAMLQQQIHITVFVELVEWCGTDAISLTLRFVKRYSVCTYVPHNTGIRNGCFNGIK